MAELNLDDAEFDDLFDKVITPALAPFEADRKRLVGRYFLSLLAAAIGAPALVGLIYLIFKTDSDFPWFIGLIAFGAGVTLSYGPLAKFTKRCKTAILTRLAQAIGLTYVETFTPPGFDEARALHILPPSDRSEFEDLFQGSRQGCAFELYEAKLEDKRGSGKDEHWVTVFGGQVIRIAYPKKFLGKTVVARQGSRLIGRQGFQRIGMGASQFERIFEVFGTDQVESRFLVHPAFMERLLALENGRTGADVRCAFSGGYLLIAVDGANLFEVVKVFSKVPDRALTRTGVTQIGQILAVIDVVMAPPPKAYG
ncbi:DUF3137 domain-containing protein [soil metagenome]